MRAERKMKESQKKDKPYRKIFEFSPQVIAFIDSKGNVLEVNKRVYDWLGYQPKEVVGKNFLQLPFLSEESKFTVKRKLAQVFRADNIPPYEVEFDTKAGEGRTGRIFNIPIRDKRGDRTEIMVMAFDITERKKAEQALRESEELFRSIVENSHAGIMIVDDSYRLTYINDKGCRITGYLQKEIIGQDFRKFLDEESRKLVMDRYVRRQRGEKVPSRYEFNVVRKDGEKRRVEISSTVIKDKSGRIQTVAQILDITERKQAEEALKESIRDYQGLFEHAHDAILVFAPEKEVILDVNPSACELYGFSREEFIGMSLESLSENIAQGKRRLKKTLKKGALHNFETIHYRRDGSEILLEINAAVVNYKGQKAVLSVHRDITKHKKAEERLRMEKAYLDRLFESAQEGIVMSDPAGKVMRVNSEFTRIFGYKREEVLGRNVDELVVPRRYLKNGVSITNKVAAGENVNFEAVRQRKDGKLMDVSVLASPIVADGEVVAIYAIYRDITERKRAEEKLRVSEEKYRNLVELSPDAILFLDMKGTITACNTFMTKATGYSKEEIVGKHLTELELLPDEDTPKYMELIYTASKGEVPKPFEVTWYHKDGTAYLSEIRIGFIKEEGENIGVQIVARDITERKQAEEKIKSALNEREVMLREIHHRVKNNMQIISSLLRLQSRQIKSKKTLGLFNVGQNRIRSMALIHESLYQSSDLAKINFSDYIKRLTTHLLSTYRVGMERIRLKLDVRDVWLDINRAIPCGLIINELVSNSLRHAFPGDQRGDVQVIMNANKQGKYSLVVNDTGVGFPEDVDFQQTETLGMQLVIDLVSQLGGTIKLKREKGTKFRIVF